MTRRAAHRTPPRGRDVRIAVRAVGDVVAARDDAKAGSIEPVDTMESAVKDARLVIEAVPEKLDLKKSIFGDLDSAAEADAILASNYSSYPTSQFIDNVEHPERVLNMHFYMPPAQNAVDLISDGQTDDAIIDFLRTELPKYGVHPFEARKESTGFIFNRIWAAIKRESLAVVEEGVADPDDVDQMFMINIGTKASPFRMMDQVGLDVVLDIENHYAEENPHLPEGPRRLLHKYVYAGKLGVKSGEGFYDHKK